MFENIKSMHEHNNKVNADQLQVLLKNTRIDERKNIATLMTVKFELLAAHIRNENMTAAQVADLLNSESEKIKHEVLEND
ncbi:DUF2732 family protein [Limnobaculum xujianqingii]|uniref:DUF2732 family protein n=1 Tax=Limnobaculum xujianqingii TaxID=2738837 RepID=UPI0015BCE2F1|nr:DUF2732 family protein [Limnobaculum xujianqingii]